MKKNGKSAENARYPVLFCAALSQNGKALEYFDAATEEERFLLAEGSRYCRSAEEMRAYVDAMVGWEEGHPPYQL